MNADEFAQPLTFIAVDGLAHAGNTLERGGPHGKWQALQLGPLLELESLSTQNLIPQWFMTDHLLPGKQTQLLSALRTRQHLTPRHGSASPGVFHAKDLAAEHIFTGFKIAARKAAEAAGFPSRSAAQLAAALGELGSNVVEHSEATNTGALCYSWSLGSFEFGVMDQGIGILASLKTCPEFDRLTDHGEALRIATAEGASRFGSNSGRGMGFKQIFLGLMNHKGHLRFRSGDHALILDGKSPTLASARLAEKSPMRGFTISISCEP